jgi:hypothetical protein
VANVLITKSIVAFYDVITAIRDNLTTIEQLQAQVNDPVTGIAQSKKLIRQSMIRTAASIMQTVFAYATKTGNSDLAAKMQTTPSALSKQKDAQLAATITAAITTITGIVGQLAEYNITQPIIDAWNEQLTAFKDIMSDPKVAHSNTDAIRNSIQDYLRACMNMLYSQADTISSQFKETNITYYRNYRKNRKLQPLTIHTKLHATVLNDSGNPLAGVRIQQDNTSNYVITDALGQADLYIQIPKAKASQTIKPVYTFTLTNDTITTKSGDITIRKGNSVSVKFTMAQTGFVIPEHIPQTKEKVAVEK